VVLRRPAFRSLTDRDVLPEAIASVVADEALVSAALSGGDPDPPDGTERTYLTGQARSDPPVVLGERLLMPLATNADQERIARQLATSHGVTVQGPPGTGKSHTIANLICHLVAHGQRVLVTAQDERALGLLRDKIPPELRNLRVAVLGSSRADLDELRAAVVEISGALGEVDPARETAAVRTCADELDAARARARALELRMIDLLRADRRPPARRRPAFAARRRGQPLRHRCPGVPPQHLGAQGALPLPAGHHRFLQPLLRPPDPAIAGGS
jgi:hypothetical protein